MTVNRYINGEKKKVFPRLTVKNEAVRCAVASAGRRLSEKS